MKKNSPMVKAILVLVIGSVLGYLGLNVPQDYIEEVVDEQLGEVVSESTEAKNVLTSPSTVVSVIDGDTFVISTGGEKQTVRVLGIDTPETEYSPAGAECYGGEATERAEDLLFENKVVLQTDPNQAATDAYDRLLAYVELEDGRDFGELMIRGGFAREFTYQNTFYKNQSLYIAVEREAEREGVGVWGCV